MKRTALVLLAFFLGGFTGWPSRAEKMNVVMIVIDDLNDYVTGMGAKGFCTQLNRYGILNFEFVIRIRLAMRTRFGAAVASRHGP